LNIGNKCKELIVKNSGLIDKSELRDDILPRFITHVYVLESAFNEKIKGNTEDYDDFVFPREMDESVLQHIVFLQGQLTGQWSRIKSKIVTDWDLLIFKTLTPTQKIKLSNIRKHAVNHSDRINANILLLRNKKYTLKEICKILDINTIELKSSLKKWNERDYLSLFSEYDKF
jgi:hypothetical protein